MVLDGDEVLEADAVGVARDEPTVVRIAVAAEDGRVPAGRMVVAAGDVELSSFMRSRFQLAAPFVP